MYVIDIYMKHIERYFCKPKSFLSDILIGAKILAFSILVRGSKMFTFTLQLLLTPRPHEISGSH